MMACGSSMMACGSPVPSRRSAWPSLRIACREPAGHVACPCDAARADLDGGRRGGWRKRDEAGNNEACRRVIASGKGAHWRKFVESLLSLPAMAAPFIHTAIAGRPAAPQGCLHGPFARRPRLVCCAKREAASGCVSDGWRAAREAPCSPQRRRGQASRG